MTETEFIDNVRRRTAIVCVGASALRNQGAADIIKTSRAYFTDKILLPDFFGLLSDQEHFKNYLNQHTENLRTTYADGGQNWGTARKALNLFFRDIVYNRYLSDFYGLPTEFAEQNRVLRNLEVPLDRDVGTNLNEIDIGLPKWTSIKDLGQPKSDKYQASALAHADSFVIARVHLDLRFWRQPLADSKARTANMVLAQAGLTNIF